MRDLEERKSSAQAHFERLRDEICALFEHLEEDADPGLYPGTPATFVKTRWARERGRDGSDQGGGVMGMMRGRLFEKVGVHTSTVFGQLNPEMSKQIKGAQGDPRFWASGISLIAHMRNPRVPAVHMNLRFIATSESWFGGGADLNPMVTAQRSETSDDRNSFHGRLKAACDAHDPLWYRDYKKWADDYFWLPHRGEPRGVGGIFFDHHNTGNFARDLAFVKDVGEAFKDIFPAIVRRRMGERWSEAESREQAKWRGRYVEFNLLYDRGTQFGLKTGGNVESILSSMPPSAEWP